MQNFVQVDRDQHAGRCQGDGRMAVIDPGVQLQVVTQPATGLTGGRASLCPAGSDIDGGLNTSRYCTYTVYSLARGLFHDKRV